MRASGLNCLSDQGCGAIFEAMLSRRRTPHVLPRRNWPGLQVCLKGAASERPRPSGSFLPRDSPCGLDPENQWCRQATAARSRQALGFAVGVALPVILLLLGAIRVPAEILWSDVGARVIHQTPEGGDILGGSVSRDDTASDALYFKFKVDPLSDVASEEYYALFQLIEDGEHRLGVGNAPEAWGYSACFTADTGPHNQREGEFDLKSSQPEAAGLGEIKPYELPRHNRERTIIFKVQYVPDGDDLVTVWLDPNLQRGGSDENQEESLTTRFKARASFDELRLRHAGGGNGWIFSDMAIATSFADFVIVRFWQTWWFTSGFALALLVGVVAGVRLVEKRKFQGQLHLAEQERALEHERSRIARDLHDELGSSLARISLLSNLVRLDKDQPAEVEAHATKLAHSADQTVRALEEIVWAVRPGSDSLQGLMDYIAHFADEMSEEKAMRCRLDLPPDLPDRPLPPEVRHNIFLVVKEALANAMKHAGATEVLVRAQADANSLQIMIQDNGRGFDSNQVDSADDRNGLQNMQRRAEAVNGTLELESSPGTGTCVRLTARFQ
jgi:signal transduction histidine kinase